MNICIFKGWVAEKPELKQTTTGKTVTRFQIAVPRRFKAQDGKREYDYITVEAWESRADFCGRHLDKGSEVVIECELRIDKYEKDGTTRYRHIYALANIEFCTGRAANQQNTAPQTAQYVQPQYTAPAYTAPATPDVGYEEVQGDEDLPF